MVGGEVNKLKKLEKRVQMGSYNWEKVKKYNIKKIRAMHKKEGYNGESYKTVKKWEKNIKYD